MHMMTYQLVLTRLLIRKVREGEILVAFFTMLCPYSNYIKRVHEYHSNGGEIISGRKA